MRGWENIVQKQRGYQGNHKIQGSGSMSSNCSIHSVALLVLMRVHTGPNWSQMIWKILYESAKVKSSLSSCEQGSLIGVGGRYNQEVSYFKHTADLEGIGLFITEEK